MIDPKNFWRMQVEEPFNPTPMLIHADHLEEGGDPIAAMVFRGLSSAEFPTIQMIALQLDLLTPVGAPAMIDEDCNDICGFGYGETDGHLEHAGEGCGAGDGCAEPVTTGDGYGDKHCNGHGDGDCISYGDVVDQLREELSRQIDEDFQQARRILEREIPSYSGNIR